ncbi:MAG: hypothetical protein J6S08_03800 [Duodenibacillus sp.]|jgi:hypothetical protein|nr:hypothetical protein [Duodenibacillus sp.]
MQENQQSVERPDLADPRVIYQVCFQFIEMHMELNADMYDEKVTPEDAAARSSEWMQWLSWTLCGENDEFKPAEGWSGAPLGQHLRKVFEKEFQNLSHEDAQIFFGDEEAVMFAMCQFVTEIHQLLSDLQFNTEDETEQDARAFHNLCVRWAEILTNKPFPAIEE